VFVITAVHCIAVLFHLYFYYETKENLVNNPPLNFRLSFARAHWKKHHVVQNRTAGISDLIDDRKTRKEVPFLGLTFQI